MTKEDIGPEEALDILKKASDSLSHASYCAIVGQIPNHAAIVNPWDDLRLLIKCLDPDNWPLKSKEDEDKYCKWEDKTLEIVKFKE